VPAGYVIAEFAILFALFYLSVLDFHNGYRLYGVILLAHAVALLYAIKVFLGFRYAFRDVAALWQRQGEVKTYAKMIKQTLRSRYSPRKVENINKTPTSV
jgi:hypothetical protein